MTGALADQMTHFRLNYPILGVEYRSWEGLRFEFDSFPGVSTLVLVVAPIKLVVGEELNPNDSVVFVAAPKSIVQHGVEQQQL
ncbi:uncharacterized protein CCR75_008531 [Bremia lactucae]|uniref:Uncharacterized protein n=1 Tax=Bremia lactucae TaxID=4779 RepID=A0A976FQ13_BRELC|nr:hypothetical protein CCR75_008539 [Bremia lactucae]TDH71023.1 hypothetical protein CCR75_008531 [Bremia lactucae]